MGRKVTQIFCRGRAARSAIVCTRSISLRTSANGSPQPFNVKYWGVGNEAWGCGGNFCPEDYAAEYKRYATYLRDFGEAKLFLIACGPDGNAADGRRRPGDIRTVEVGAFV